MFAHDTNVFSSHKNADQLVSIVNTEFIKVLNWLNINKLSLNVNKHALFLFIGAGKHYSKCSISY